MTVHRCGTNLHGQDGMRLCTMNNRVLIRSNDIGSHPAFNTRNKYNLAAFIANRLRNHPSEDSIRKLKGMVNNVLNKRVENQRLFQAQHERNISKIKGRLAALRALPQTPQIQAFINHEMGLFTHGTSAWLTHKDQIKYWRWVKNSAVPQAGVYLRRMRA